MLSGTEAIKTIKETGTFCVLWSSCTLCLGIYSIHMHDKCTLQKYLFGHNGFRNSQEGPWLTSEPESSHKLLFCRNLSTILFCNPRGRSLPGCWYQEIMGTLEISG